MHATLGYLRIIRWLAIIRAVSFTARFSGQLSDWIGEHTGLNDALRSALEDLDRREAGSEPPSGPQAIS
jgi:hypothetical protein